MPTIETEFKHFRLEVAKEIAELKRIIITHMVPDKWVKQDVACMVLNVKARQLANIRIHTNKEGNPAGSIRWKKGKGKNCLYYLPDIEKYNGA